jgi:alpha-tubulin suppressor-like RCC1 family protein/subtilisin-like proprotein convertase family protein
VSGMLALMEDFFVNGVQLSKGGRVTNSPALMKALVINGARSVNSSLYDFNTENTENSQGWGLVNLPTSLPGMLFNVLNQAVGTPTSMLVFDQNPTNALATGQSITYNIAVTNAADNQPLRITLVWTDPPGDPAAAIKLVNDLDLVVTDLDDGFVYYGNNIYTGSIYNQPWDTNDLPALDTVKDFVNNVENVYIQQPYGANYSITVNGYRVNVNAVTAQTNTLANGTVVYAPNIVQDYALVISSGDGAITNAITLSGAPVQTAVQQSTNNLTYLNDQVTNNVAILFNQLVGANAPLLGLTTNLIGETNLSDGTANQWTFYVFTNNAGGTTNLNFTNVAFGTFNAFTMAIPREGVFAGDLADATRQDADIDLFVSTNPALFNLDPVTLSNCVLNVYDSGYCSSLGLGGTETVTFTNSYPGEVYYVGVQSEDQMGAQYDFFGVATTNSFGNQQPNGDIIVTPQVPLLPAPIPDAGGPSQPGALTMICIVATPQPITVSRVIATNWLEHQLPSDLIGTLSHGNAYDVLNNHTIQTTPGAFNNPIVTGLINGGTNQFLIYDDSGANNIPGAQRSDGPGSLNNFMGSVSSGQWMLNMVDSVHTHIGYESNLWLHLVKSPDTNILFLTLPPNSTSGIIPSPYVSPGATNLGIGVISYTGPVGMIVRGNAFPSFGPPPFYDYTNYYPTAVPGDETNVFNINLDSIPPLQTGIYYIDFTNLSSSTITLYYYFSLAYNTNSETTQVFTSSNAVPLLDDAVTDGSIGVTNTNTIASVEVGVRIAHPRESDLALTLISPTGTRVLLAENRGGTYTNGYGSTVSVTNVYPNTSTGGTNENDNFINTYQTSGTLNISYNFYTQPDKMVVYYGDGTNGTVLTNTGYISGSGQFSLNYGPGSSTYVTIVMNPGGNSDNGVNQNDAWTYTASVADSYYNYFTFTDDTNKTTIPIKFYPPPFVGTLATNVMFDGFEAAVAGNYTNSQMVDGWSVTSNFVSVLSDPVLAQTGTNCLALGSGTIYTNLPTVAGHTYSLSYAYRNFNVNPVDWWKGEGNTTDSIAGGPTGAITGGVTYTNGEVGQAFNFAGTGTINFGTSAGNFGTNDFTISFWLKTADTSVYYVMAKRAGCVVNNFWSLAIGSGSTANGKINFGVCNGTYLFGLLGNRSVNDGVYHYIAITRQGLLYSVYIDGVLDVSGTATQVVDLDSTAPFTVGTSSCTEVDGTTPYQGQLDEIAFYSNTLSQAEVQSIYQDGALQTSQIQAIVMSGTNGLCGTPTPPSLCGPASAQVALAGVFTDILATTNSNWVVTNHTFTATAANMQLQAQGLEPGILLDSFSLTDLGSGGYALPEESLDAVQGEYANGSGLSGDAEAWQLEVWDSRTGAFLPAGNQLLSWRLSFVYENSVLSALARYGIAFDTTPTNLTVTPGTTITVTNAATDANTNATLTYSLLDPPSGATINPGTGVITWTPTVAGTNTITTVVTDNGTPPLSATNSFTVTVTAPLGPYAATLPATQVSATGATLNGLATANAATATAWFQWGTSASYGNIITALPATATGTGVTSVDNILNSLASGIYHYQLVVSNSVGVAYGADQIIAIGGKQVWAWGDNTYGQTNVPGNLTNAVAIAGGGYHSLAIDTTGTAWAWGDHSSGQFGINGKTGIAGIAGGLEHSLALTAGGTVEGWGDDTYGETDIPAGLNNVIAIASGSYHNLALRNDGTVVAWGYNLFGQTNVPPGLSNVVAVAAGGVHSLALKNDGTVVAWGDDTFGETSVPAGLSNIVAVAAGGAFSVALNTNGTVFAWGASPDGETNVSTFAGVGMIAAQLSHGLEVYNNDSSVIGWGFDSSYVNEPQNEYGLYFTDIQAVAAGGYHGLVLGDRSPSIGVVAVAPQSVAAAVSQSGGFQFTLSWVAPTNEAFMVQWTPSAATGGWRTFTNVITSTSGTFIFTDNGSETGGNGSERYYRLMTTQLPQ